MQLTLDEPSGNVVPALGSGTLTQSMTVRNPSKAQLRMRLRLSSSSPSAGPEPVHHQGEVNQFPAALFS